MSAGILPEKVIVRSDGGSRGNPGEAALGVLLADEKGRVLKKYGQVLGVMTNNQAEYEAIIFALKKLKSLLGGRKAAKTLVEIRSDSELLVSQLQGRYKILDEKIQLLFIKVWNLKIDFQQVNFIHVPREENREADRLVNEALDQGSRVRRMI